MLRVLQVAVLATALTSVSAQVTISGVVVGDAGEAVRGIRVHLAQVSFADCCRDENRAVANDGTFAFDVPPAVYALIVEGRTPFYPRTIRVDARNGNHSGIRVELSPQPKRYVPDDPPRAGKISVSTPNEAGETVVRGAAGTVAPNNYVIVVNTDTGEPVFTEAAGDGSFEARLFAPAGTSVLIKTDPYGDTTRSVASQAVQPMGGNLIPPFSLPGITFDANTSFNIGPLAPLPGTYVDVPLPAASDGRVAIGGGGGPNSSSVAGLPYWVVRGSMNKSQFLAGETVEITVTITISSPLVAGIEKIRANPFVKFERLTLADGQPTHPHGVQASSLLTPAGLGIMHTSSMHLGVGMPLDIPRIAPDRAEASFTLRIALPADFPSGFYRGVMSIGFSGYPNEIPLSRPQLLMDSSNREGPNVIALPPIRVGNPASPRLYWTLLTDTLSEGTRGAMPIEDERCCAVTAIVQVPAKSFIVPRIDERTQSPLVYRIEPFALMTSSGDRGLTPPPPAVRFRFPSGRLTARVERPDGQVQTIGPAPFVQGRVTGPIDRHGRTLDPGGLALHDAYQLTTLDPRFEIVFPMEGAYRITLEGEIEDLAGKHLDRPRHVRDSRRTDSRARYSNAAGHAVRGGECVHALGHRRTASACTTRGADAALPR